MKPAPNEKLEYIIEERPEVLTYLKTSDVNQTKFSEIFHKQKHPFF